MKRNLTAISRALSELKSKTNIARRTQESFGFMIAIGTALTIFLLFSGIINADNATSSNAASLLKARSLNEKLASSVFRSFMNGPGSEENLTLESISEDNYTIYVRPGNVILIQESGRSQTNPTNAYKVIESQVTYGSVSVKNIEGWINVSQI